VDAAHRHPFELDTVEMLAGLWRATLVQHRVPRTTADARTVRRPSAPPVACPLMRIVVRKGVQPDVLADTV
jgi:hypothetical protein